ncbi:APC family permease [Amycolatopsis thermalba]|uniref:APC family permease n=1 Tax=Amycolatopsis thermalba TaxID=944492 RepID=A0ABY4P0X9_9PSEU|nr:MULTISPECIES: APC family permease [Amycolatopsis]UQS25995.1 APC family permease [Amycolatopsis thermalba]
MSDSTPVVNPPSTTDLGTGAVPDKLSGRMGVGSLMLTVLAFSAPIAVVAGFIPFTVTFGGEGATFAFVATTILLLLFAVGYVTMTRRIPKPGSFYAFVSAGLGKISGLGAAFLAVVSYLLMLGGCFVFLGLTATELIESIGGPTTPWWLWGALAWAVVGVLCYFHIEVSAKVLSVAMVLEVTIAMIFNVAVVLHGGGPDGFSATPFSPAALSHGDVGVTMLFAVMVFLGFEATAVFRDEVRTPDRTIPRATYGAVLFVGVLYILSCYLLTTAYGSGAVDAATNDPKSMFPAAIGQFVAPFFTQLTFLFIITSELAAAISVHNVVARYLFNLGRDRALPAYVAKVHPRHHSPARASTVTAVIVAVVLIPLGLTNTSGVGLDAQLFGLATVGLLALMAVVSVSVIVWFARTGRSTGENSFKCYIAPGIAALALGATVVLAVLHFDLVVGGAPGQNLVLLTVLAVSAIAGVGLALYFKSARPRTYAGLGQAAS